MGTPTASEPEMKPIDATVGALVWVRRRNGSWWPGRIVGADELPDDSLVSPKSGTPVKLLGRDNATVDWYNLDKSKRVKAFRCGEYDECIERAKASSASSSKKAVKYARRDDAILQALELEGGLQLKGSPTMYSNLDMNGGEQHVTKESEKLSESAKESGHMGEELGCVEGNSKSTEGLTQSGTSSEMPNQKSAMAKQLPKGRRRRTPNDSEDDGTEGVKRMKGLDDLGMGAVSSGKRKRSQTAHVQEFLKRKTRRRPVTKVLESVISEGTSSPSSLPLTGVLNGKVSEIESKDSLGSFSVILNNSDSMGVSCENGASENASEYASDATLNNSSRKEIQISSTSVPADSDASKKLFDVPFLLEENKQAGVAPFPLSHSSLKTQVGADKQSSQNSQVETASLDNEVHIECVSTSLGAADIGSTNPRKEQVSSKWQSKGKRNIRRKNKTKRRDLSKCLGVRKDDVPADVGPGLEAVKTSPTDEFLGQNDDISQKAPRRLMPCRQSRFVLNPKYESLDYPIKKSDSDGDLFDVNVEVSAGSRPHHVPYISLMSKLHGRPITGHPLTVEVLESGVCDLLLSNHAREGTDVDNEVKQDQVGGSRPPKKRRASTSSCASPGKSSKNKKNGKTRKLSSLSGSQKRREDKKKPLLSKLNGPAIPCLPVKVVFSRFLGDLRRYRAIATQGNP